MDALKLRNEVRILRSLNIGNGRSPGMRPIDSLYCFYDQLTGVVVTLSSIYPAHNYPEIYYELQSYRASVLNMCDALSGGLHSGPVLIAPAQEAC